MLPAGLAVSGAILVDQVHSIDRFARNIRVAGEASMAVVAEVQAKLGVLLGVER